MIDVSIGRMELRLPPVFQDRARAIAREVGAGLRLQLLGDPAFGQQAKSLKRLEVPPLELDPALSDRRLGLQIAAAICQQLRDGAAQEN
ncbi:MAG: hypothetical protein HWE39_11755 [Oceanospirillaceae bacterium]|nr:hypothetical protein [Oceanospirillaceae bacterium]